MLINFHENVETSKVFFSYDFIDSSLWGAILILYFWGVFLNQKIIFDIKIYVFLYQKIKFVTLKIGYLDIKTIIFNF